MNLRTGELGVTRQRSAFNDDHDVDCDYDYGDDDYGDDGDYDH